MAKSYTYLLKKAGLPLPQGRKFAPPRRRKVLYQINPLPRAVTEIERRFSEEERELFARLFSRLTPHEDKHFTTIYGLAIALFPYVYGCMPCDVPRFQAYRMAAANGKQVQLFDSAP